MNAEAILIIALAFVGAFCIALGFVAVHAWRLWVKLWYDTTTNWATAKPGAPGHYVLKDVLRFVFGFGAAFYFIVLTPLVFFMGKGGLPETPGVIMAGAAGLLNWQKIQATLASRLTKDGAGNAMTVDPGQVSDNAEAPLPLQRQGPPAEVVPPAPD